MKTLLRLITIVLFTLFMISMSSCGSRSGKLAEERLNNSHDVAYVEFSGNFILVNDTIALDKLDSAVFVKQKKDFMKEYRYFLAK